jgi:hypothetical protein
LLPYFVSATIGGEICYQRRMLVLPYKVVVLPYASGDATKRRVAVLP